MKRVLVLADAANDLERGQDFYNSQAEEVGDHFLSSMLSEMEKLERLHGIHSMHFGFFRMLTSRFPFGIYYEVTDDAVEIYAVLDLRRDPLWIRVELETR
jgi:hypothetical protein